MSTRLIRALLIVLFLINIVKTQAADSIREELKSDASSSPTLFFHLLREDALNISEPIVELPKTDLVVEDKLENDEPLPTGILEENTRNFLRLQSIFGELNSYSNSFGNKLADYISKGEVVTGYQLHLLMKVFASYHLLSVKLKQYTDLYSLSGERTSRYFIDDRNPNLTKQNLIWLLGKLEIADKLYRGYQIYYKKEGKLRRMLKSIYKINNDTKDMAEELKSIVKGSLDKDARKELQTYLKRFDDSESIIANLVETDAQIGLLAQQIKSNPGYDFFRQGKKVKLKNYGFVDGLVELSGAIVNTLSGLFGNMAGAIKFRKGYMWGNALMAEEIRSQLKPLDVIFEKTPFALTDRFIPGYFGHSALWLGTEEELKNMGMWDHPSIVPYHDRIRRGYSIAEALRPGVSMNTIAGFLNIDHVAILRLKNVLDQANKEEIPGIYERALRNMGKDYDFNFDVSTTDKIVCSELIYHAFGFIKFPVKYRLGRQTIEPDLIAEVKYYDSTPFEFRFFAESFAKDKIERLRDWDLGERLGFKLNKDRSTEENLSYDREKKICRTVKVPKKTFGKTKLVEKNVCTTEWVNTVYEPPKDLGVDQTFDFNIQ